MFFDSHAHINDAEDIQDRLTLAKEIEESGKLSFVADIGYDLESSKRAAEDAGLFSWCVAAVGVHPHDANTMDDDIYEQIKRLTYKKRVCAIGEIGLDYHYMNSDKDSQRYWFRKQIALANELKMPIVVHSRDADRETMDILIEEGAFSSERASMFNRRVLADGKEANDPHVVIHCFSGSKELAREYTKLGATIGICGPVTYKNNKKTVGVVKEIPLEYIMVETDSPYLTPVPKRGKRNKPMYVQYTVEKIAEIKGVDVETVTKVTRENARRFYGI